MGDGGSEGPRKRHYRGSIKLDNFVIKVIVNIKSADGR